jgi:hypothetical protein
VVMSDSIARSGASDSCVGDGVDVRAESIVGDDGGSV